MTVSINGSPLNIQPSNLKEELLQIQTDQETINGSMYRNRIGQKKQSTLSFPIVKPSDYQVIISQFTTGSGVFYNNDATSYGANFAMSGLPSFSESEYIQGGSLYRQFDVVIREQ